MGCSVTGAAKSAGCDILGEEKVGRNEEVKGRPQEDVEKWATKQDIDWLLKLYNVRRRGDDNPKYALGHIC